MKFAIELSVTHTRITTSLGEFDGAPPVGHLEFDLTLGESANADRLAVGLALIYSPWLAGPTTFPKPVSALTAQRITEFFGERFVTVGNVTDRALPIPRGSHRVTVVDLVGDADTDARLPALKLASYSQREGLSSLGSTTTVASNIHALGAGLGPTAVTLQTLGLGVLLSEEADINVLLHPAAGGSRAPLRSLLEAVGLGLMLE